MIYKISPFGMGSGITNATVIIIITLLVFISMMIWVYKDAKQRNMEASLYLVLIFFFNCCGLIIYFLARADHPVGGQAVPDGSFGPRLDTNQRAQPQYGQTQNRKSLYGQPQYGQTQAPPSSPPQKVSQITKFCRYCGGEMPNDARFCSICGANEFNN
jgi:hypothetical protein